MEMEVVVPVPPHHDFNFDSACSSPYMTAPSSPQRFGNFYFSAPTSPTRASAFYSELNHLSSIDGRDIVPRYSASSIPFKWEEKPGIPKCSKGGEEDFEFDFSGQLDITSLTAEELFDGGKIKPLKPPPRLQVGVNDSPGSSSITSPRSPRSPRSRICQGKKMVQEVLSPRHKKDFDPFTAALKQTRKSGDDEHEEKRGGRVRSSTSSSFVRKGTRSLSPLRVSDIVEFDQEEKPAVSPTTSNAKPTSTSTPPPSSSSSAYSSFLSAISFSKGYRKWRLKDFLLFRSASEGRATAGNDPLRKYSMLSKNKTGVGEDLKNSSFRSTESGGSVSSRRRGPVSAHEIHYTVNRAVSEEMRKKTVLPYKHGLLGCLGFNHGMNDLSRSFGSFTRG
ncbi:hypothetical protein FNV43_RR22460 [Rhamnella rubrinervis]|uniref:Calmodulin-binding protein n=1 Tax=Rhamnella rubrinervis TaxID=2594499 RepID=A0A8K0GS36_9ROSA|nr:hypothetical protein FNV43_RR22460 [Rhamnella rubrinervis]